MTRTKPISNSNPPRKMGFRSGVIPGLTMLAVSVFSAPAHANVFAFYDIYLRPAVSSDFPAGGAGVLLPDYTLSSASPPVDTTADQWADTVNVMGAMNTSMTIHYTFAMSDTTLALVTPGTAAVTGKVYEPVTLPGVQAKVMPGTTDFDLTFTSTSAMVYAPVRFDVQGHVYQFADSSADSVSNKGVIYEGFLTATDADVPEPESLFTLGGGGLLLLLMAARRRKRNQALTAQDVPR